MERKKRGVIWALLWQNDILAKNEEMLESALNMQRLMSEGKNLSIGTKVMILPETARNVSKNCLF